MWFKAGWNSQSATSCCVCHWFILVGIIFKLIKSYLLYVNNSHYLTFSPLKSTYAVFRPKTNYYFIPNMTFSSTALLLKCDGKCLGFILKNSFSDNEVILKVLRTLYIRLNVILRTFKNVVLMWCVIFEHCKTKRSYLN